MNYRTIGYIIGVIIALLIGIWVYLRNKDKLK